MKFLFCFFSLFICFSIIMPQRLYCESSASTEPEPYGKDEFPQWAKDLRRFEIVSLGSVPFAMIGVTLAYGAIEMNRGNISSIPNPLNPSSFDEGEQLKVLGLTLAVGVGIGLVDFSVNLLSRHIKKKRQEKINAAKQVNVIPISQENLMTENIESSDVEIKEVSGDTDDKNSDLAEKSLNSDSSFVEDESITVSQEENKSKQKKTKKERIKKTKVSKTIEGAVEE